MGRKVIDWGKFKQRRLDLRLSMAAVKNLVGVSPSVVSNFEQGRNIPTGDNVVRLMFIYSLNPEDLIVDENELAREDT